MISTNLPAAILVCNFLICKGASLLFSSFISTIMVGILVTLRELGTGIDGSKTGVKYLAATQLGGVLLLIRGLEGASCCVPL